jgi:hypothetical protein
VPTLPDRHRAHAWRRDQTISELFYLFETTILASESICPYIEGVKLCFGVGRRVF